jgi:hypothetical protein
VLDGRVVGEVLIGIAIDAAFIGEQVRLAGNVLADDDVDRGFVCILYMEGTDGTTALNKGDYGALIGRAGFTRLGERTAASSGGTTFCRGLLPKIGFVGLDGATTTAHGRERARPHCFANTVRHEPRGLESNPKDAVKLIGAEALLRGRKKREPLKPNVHGNVA